MCRSESGNGRPIGSHDGQAPRLSLTTVGASPGLLITSARASTALRAGVQLSRTAHRQQMQPQSTRADIAKWMSDATRRHAASSAAIALEVDLYSHSASSGDAVDTSRVDIPLMYLVPQCLVWFQRRRMRIVSPPLHVERETCARVGGLAVGRYIAGNVFRHACRAEARGR